jgi:hypothetical protein
MAMGTGPPGRLLAAHAERVRGDLCGDDRVCRPACACQSLPPHLGVGAALLRSSPQGRAERAPTRRAFGALRDSLAVLFEA